MLKIESAQNDTFKKLLGLISSRGLKKDDLFLLSGKKLIEEFLGEPHLRIAFEIVPPASAPLTDTKIYPDTKIVQLSSELFTQLDVLGTHFNILALEQPKMATLESKDLASYAPRGIEVVMPVGDPGNLGALLRSCEAFAVPRVILTQEAAHPLLPKAVKASAGSVLRLPMLNGPALSEFPDTCLALDIDGTPLDDFDWPANGLLVVGEEGPGFSAKKFKRRIRVPTQNVESLNVVVAASIALAHRARRR